MADYNKDIEDNKGKIRECENKIKDAETNRPQSDDDKANIMRWGQEIKELKLENEIMGYKRDVPNFRTDATMKAGLKELTDKLEDMQKRHPQEREKLNQGLLELERVKASPRSGDAQAIEALAETVERLKLENQLRDAKSTTTRVEVYADYETKKLISTLQLAGNIPQFPHFKTNKWTRKLGVRPFFFVVFFKNISILTLLGIKRPERSPSYTAKVPGDMGNRRWPLSFQGCPGKYRGPWSSDSGHSGVCSR